MTHSNHRYRGRRNAQQRKEFCEAQRKRVEKRWAKYHEGLAGEPTRLTRVTILTVRDSCRPMTTVRLVWSESGRCHIWQDGVHLRVRPQGKRGLSEMLARMLG